MAKKKKTDAANMDSVEYTRTLVRKAWAEMGIEEPKDTVAYVRGLVEKGLAELPERRGKAG